MLSAYYYLLVTKYESTGRKLCVGLCACVGEDVKILRVACLRIRSSSNLIGDFLVVCLRNYGASVHHILMRTASCEKKCTVCDDRYL